MLDTELHTMLIGSSVLVTYSTIGCLDPQCLLITELLHYGDWILSACYLLNLRLG